MSPSVWPTSPLGEIVYEALTVIKGFRNGLVYGAKIRLPHAFVMTLLFREGSWEDKAKNILRATSDHAWNLARFVAIYKSVMILLRRLFDDDGLERSWHPLLAGALGGFLIFRKDNPINNQIVMYLLSRVLVGLVSHACTPSAGSRIACQAFQHDHRFKSRIIGIVGWLAENSFAIQATFVWAVIMWLFRYDRAVLQPSLQSSMQYLYNDSDSWNSLRNLLILNR